MGPVRAITGEIFSRHEMQYHAECSLRLHRAITGIPAGTEVITPGPAARGDLCRVHLPWYVDEIASLSAGITDPGEGSFLDPDTYIVADSYRVACHAAGAAIGAAEGGLSHTPTFAICRPPGHHALPDRAMGYCLFNNVAIAAAWALERVPKVAILDWDLHHGNGTQEIFLRSDRVFYSSLHHRDSFPHSGWADEVGEDEGKGYTLNAPLARGCTLSDYLAVISSVIGPAIEDFGPDLLLISAGLDALHDDPAGVMKLYPQDYAALVTAVSGLSPSSPALVLEGGYGPSIGEAVSAIFSALQGCGGAAGSRVESEGAVRPSTRDLIKLLSHIHR